MDIIIEIENLNFKYNDKKIFSNLNLKINKGDFVTIAGKGKTTLIKMIKGDYNYDGNIIINNKNMSIISEDIYNRFIDGTVRDNIKYHLKNKNVDIEKNKIINGIITSFDVERFLDYNPKYLSLGEQSLISMVISLINKPKILIIDETLSMLDSVIKEKVIKNLKKLNRDGLTIINFTNDLEESLYGKRLILLNQKVALNKNIKNAFKNLKIYNELNLELPFIVKLSDKLKYYDLVDNVIMDMDKMVNHLWK